MIYKAKANKKNYKNKSISKHKYTYFITTSGTQLHVSAYIRVVIRLHTWNKSLTAVILKYTKIYSSQDLEPSTSVHV